MIFARLTHAQIRNLVGARSFAAARPSADDDDTIQVSITGSPKGAVALYASETHGLIKVPIEPVGTTWGSALSLVSIAEAKKRKK